MGLGWRQLDAKEPRGFADAALGCTSGSAAVVSRGDHGAISFRDWHPVGVEEYGYVAPDPLHPNLIYGGKASRFDETNFEVQNVAPEAIRSGKYRFVRTMPILFSAVDPRVLYLGSNVLFKSTTGGSGWDVISPDLTRESYVVPKTLGVFTSADPEKGKHRLIHSAKLCIWPSKSTKTGRFIRRFHMIR